MSKILFFPTLLDRTSETPLTVWGCPLGKAVGHSPWVVRSENRSDILPGQSVRARTKKKKKKKKKKNLKKI